MNSYTEYGQRLLKYYRNCRNMIQILGNGYEQTETEICPRRPRMIQPACISCHDGNRYVSQAKKRLK